jgi:hypothetical protein
MEIWEQFVAASHQLILIGADTFAVFFPYRQPLSLILYFKKKQN